MMKIVRAVFLLLAVLLIAGGCSTSDKAAPDLVPKGFDLPAGVTLTKAGTTVDFGSSASAIYRLADGQRSVVAVTVRDAAVGKIDDFNFFGLDAAMKESTPIYVRASIKNLGPADVGGAPVPLYAHDSTNSIAPPDEVVGNFKPCPIGVLPKTLPAGSSAEVCLVYLLPKGATLASVDLRTDDLKQAIGWRR